MEQPKPATPATAATPGNVPQGSGTPSPETPATVTPTGQGNQPEGTVTISTKEFAELQRAKARALSFDKRKEFTRSRVNRPAQPTNGEGADDPEVVAALQREQDAHAETQRRLYKAEVVLAVGGILSKPEYANLPESTKSLILRNPSALSEADNVEEALLDIEEFIRDEVAKIVPQTQTPQNKTGQGGNSPSAPGRETPPAISSGAPAPVTAVELEDVTGLTGVNRSRAVLRNALKKARGQVK